MIASIVLLVLSILMLLISIALTFTNETETQFSNRSGSNKVVHANVSTKALRVNDVEYNGQGSGIMTVKDEHSAATFTTDIDSENLKIGDVTYTGVKGQGGSVLMADKNGHTEFI